MIKIVSKNKTRKIKICKIKKLLFECHIHLSVLDIAKRETWKTLITARFQEIRTFDKY